MGEAASSAGALEAVASATSGKTSKRKEVSTLVQAIAQRSWDVDRIGRLLASGKSVFDFTTAGTSGRRPEELLKVVRLPLFDTSILVDVRASPYSQHTPSWNKGTLEASAKDHGVEYLHRPDLGVPSNVRNRLHSGDLDHSRLFAWYDQNVANDQRVSELHSLITARPLFLCTELGPTFCHRHRLALALERSLKLISFDV